jgi:hypothetical protein
MPPCSGAQKKGSREAATMAMLEKFQSKLLGSATASTSVEPTAKSVKLQSDDPDEANYIMKQEEALGTDDGWLVQA